MDTETANDGRTLIRKIDIIGDITTFFCSYSNPLRNLYPSRWVGVLKPPYGSSMYLINSDPVRVYFCEITKDHADFLTDPKWLPTISVPYAPLLYSGARIQVKETLQGYDRAIGKITNNNNILLGEPLYILNRIAEGTPMFDVPPEILKTTYPGEWRKYAKPDPRPTYGRGDYRASHRAAIWEVEKILDIRV